MVYWPTEMLSILDMHFARISERARPRRHQKTDEGVRFVLFAQFLHQRPKRGDGKVQMVLQGSVWQMGLYMTRALVAVKIVVIPMRQYEVMTVIYALELPAPKQER